MREKQAGGQQSLKLPFLYFVCRESDKRYSLNYSIEDTSG